MRDRDLARRWCVTTHAVRSRPASMQALLTLVEERALLLDELERRDPKAFGALLVRAGWREPQEQP
jgi:hypothetical protein